MKACSFAETFFIRMANYKIHNQIFVAIIANFGAFMYGIALGWSTGVSINLVDNEEYRFQISVRQFAYVVAFMPLGAAFSSIFCGILRKLWGTRLTIFLYGLPMIIGYILIMFPSNIEMLLIGRFLVGISAACYVYIPVVYTGEIASNEIRGLLLSIFFFMVYCGILFVFAVGHYTRLLTLHAIAALLPIFYSASLIFLPESPPVLISKDRIEEARSCIIFLRGKAFNVEAEIDDLKIRHQATVQRKTFRQVFSVKSTRKALFLIIGIFVVLQMTGIMMVPFYSTIIFKEAGFENNAELITVVLAGMQVISCLFALATVDKFGRKILLIASTSTMFVCLTGIATYFLLKDFEYDVSLIILLPFVLFCIYVIAFSIGLAPVSYVLLGEIFLQEAKVYVAPISKFVNFLLAYLVALSFPIFTEIIGFGATFYIYAALNLAGTFFVIFFIPETKGASLAEIQSILGM